MYSEERGEHPWKRYSRSWRKTPVSALRISPRWWRARPRRQIDAYQQAHVINGYKALIDWDKAGADRVQAIIELRVSPKRDCGFDEVAANIARFDEVDSVMLMSGGYDLSLVMSGKSFQDIALFVAKRLSPLDDVLSTATHFVLRTYKKDGVLYGLEPTDERELL